MNRRRVSWLLGCGLVALAGCATPPRPADGAGDNGPWSGRLALQVKDQASQSFAAMFELRGTAESGELTLTSPLGGTLAVLAWAPGSATLRSNGRTRSFPSVEALVTQATGAAIPVAALFDWLRGRNTPVPGWRANLSQLAEGRISAVRHEPQPEADLRVALDR
ncbi:outer membrane lipoprotein LolB [Ramlibacter sp. RBP-2]|uniref:Outer-membrane lipoprotein LolB n=1 Tax=Ramlibacter lithotrophicus TaxID=2606681 RepID=A0A7X6DI76_9BURK|nr:outer membrane lipoprotein LolB [Ramlibacter lithotrophicus]NKE67647.1 outer membrane lipoprotein LolB [Ramlibacter lithotrophicus]